MKNESSFGWDNKFYSLSSLFAQNNIFWANTFWVNPFTRSVTSKKLLNYKKTPLYEKGKKKRETQIKSMETTPKQSNKNFEIKIELSWFFLFHLNNC